MAAMLWKSNGILFFPNRAEVMTITSSAFNFALSNFHVVSSDFTATFLADKNITIFPRFCFWELNHFSKPLLVSLPYRLILSNKVHLLLLLLLLSVLLES